MSSLTLSEIQHQNILNSKIHFYNFTFLYKLCTLNPIKVVLQDYVIAFDVSVWQMSETVDKSGLTQWQRDRQISELCAGVWGKSAMKCRSRATLDI